MKAARFSCCWKHPSNTSLFSVTPTPQQVLTATTGITPPQGRVRLDTREKLLPVRVLRPWHRMPRDTADTQPLEVVQGQVGRGLVQPG